MITVESETQITKKQIESQFVSTGKISPRYKFVHSIFFHHRSYHNSSSIDVYVNYKCYKYFNHLPSKIKGKFDDMIIHSSEVNTKIIHTFEILLGAHEDFQ